MQLSGLRIGIVGAGTSGVYLASLLAEQGFQVSVFEKASQPRTEGCGILLVQAGIKALHQGNPKLCQRMIDGGDPVTQFEFRNLQGGVINSEPVIYEENELPGLLIHRKVILSSLLEFLPEDCSHFNADLESVTETEQCVIAQFRDGRRWEGDLLIGADGILSKVRQFVVPDVELNYLGDLVWRGIVEDHHFCPPGNFIVYVRGRGIYANFFHIGKHLTHWGFFLEVEQSEHEGAVLCPKNTAIPAMELAKLPADARAVIEATPPEQIISRYSYDIDPLPQLYRGRIVLIGDAAHAKSPTRARGMTAGFEDALSLSRHLSVGNDVATVLEAFQAERLPIVHEYQLTSRQQSQRIGRRRLKSAA
jgi:2-polyprenyl-6-methoxyphenol hydroxylase-like FAD-dependent oxidoreductase